MHVFDFLLFFLTSQLLLVWSYRAEIEINCLFTYYMLDKNEVSIPGSATFYAQHCLTTYQPMDVAFSNELFLLNILNNLVQLLSIGLEHQRSVSCRNAFEHCPSSPRVRVHPFQLDQARIAGHRRVECRRVRIEQGGRPIFQASVSRWSRTETA